MKQSQVEHDCMQPGKTFYDYQNGGTKTDLVVTGYKKRINDLFGYKTAPQHTIPSVGTQTKEGEVVGCIINNGTKKTC